jgi:hypothetical protein
MYHPLKFFQTNQFNSTEKAAVFEVYFTFKVGSHNPASSKQTLLIPVSSGTIIKEYRLLLSQIDIANVIKIPPSTGPPRPSTTSTLNQFDYTVSVL